jgi:hypothetical protein
MLLRTLFSIVGLMEIALFLPTVVRTSDIKLARIIYRFT